MILGKWEAFVSLKLVFLFVMCVCLKKSMRSTCLLFININIIY